MHPYLSPQEIKKHLLFRIENEGWSSEAIPKIQAVLNGYGKRGGFFGKIIGIIYRVWNAVKAIFKRSDWQKAVKAMGERAIYLNHTTDEVLTLYLKATHARATSFEEIDALIKKGA